MCVFKIKRFWLFCFMIRVGLSSVLLIKGIYYGSLRSCDVCLRFSLVANRKIKLSR